MAKLRELFGERFRSDSDLDAFAIDHFPEIYQRFTNGMDRVQKVNLLLVEAGRDRLTALLGVKGGGGEEPGRQGPIKVLFLAANPLSTTQLDLAREAEAVQDQLGGGKAGPAIEFVPRWAARRSKLQRALLEERPHVLHFSGHGERDELLFEDERGAAGPVDVEAWADLIDILRDDIRLVVLNACTTEPLAEATVRHIDAAIGMRVPITDEAAIAFAAAFYQAIAFGRSVEAAFRLGCNDLKMRGIAEDQTPRLKVKAGVDASKLVLFGKA